VGQPRSTGPIGQEDLAECLAHHRSAGGANSGGQGRSGQLGDQVVERPEHHIAQSASGAQPSSEVHAGGLGRHEHGRSVEWAARPPDEVFELGQLAPYGSVHRE
jgi:hypothetical protein